MNTLNKYNLDFCLTYEYVKNQLKNGNILSSDLLELVDFHKGQFFTLLPSEANLKNIYRFYDGGIVPAVEVNEEFEIIPTFNQELADILYDEIKYKSLSCIFEDVLRSVESTYLELFKQNNLLRTYDNYIYYVFNQSSNSRDRVLEAVRNSNAIWHFLCVLSNYDLQNTSNTKLTNFDLREFCQKVTTIVIGAFDGEGFIFWKKNNIELDFEKDVPLKSYDESYLTTSLEQETKLLKLPGSWFNEDKNELLYPDLGVNQLKKPHWDYQGVDYPDGARLFLK